MPRHELPVDQRFSVLSCAVPKRTANQDLGTLKVRRPTAWLLRELERPTLLWPRQRWEVQLSLATLEQVESVAGGHLPNKARPRREPTFTREPSLLHLLGKGWDTRRRKMVAKRGEGLQNQQLGAMLRACRLLEDRACRAGARSATPCRAASRGAGRVIDGPLRPTVGGAGAARPRDVTSWEVGPTPPGGSRGGASHSDTGPARRPAGKASFIDGSGAA